MLKNKKYKPIRYRDLTRSTDRVPQPKGKFVDPFKAMRDGQTEDEREAKATGSHQQDQTHD